MLLNKMINFREYQRSIYNNIISSGDDVVFQLETGGGKTAIINELARLKPTIVIAHRNMLVEQISQTHSRSGLNHRIVGNQQITKRCQLYQRNNGVEYCGDIVVASLQSLVSLFKRGKLAIDRMAIEQVIIDESHHLAKGNQWAEVRHIFPNARFIGATATPCRLDGRGLHKECGGVFDRLVQAEQLAENGTQWLIGNGYLCDYEYWCPPTSIDYGKLKMRGSDYTLSSIDKACSEHVVGEIIEHYQKLADYKTTIVYCARIDRAKQIANSFRLHGYSATYIASTLGFAENMRRLDAFRNGEVKILVNVEMATEGFDLAAAQCLIMLRATASLVLFKQMLGRIMRPKVDGSKAIIIDHVSNVWKHGLPDDEIVWTLYGVPKNKSEKVGSCGDCGNVFNIYLKKCPQCDSLNQLLSKPKHVNTLEKLGIIDTELVQKVRHFWKQQEIEAEREKVKLEHELSLKTKIHTPLWRTDYGKNSIGELCKKLIDWFLLNVADTDMSIATINKFTTGSKPPIDFWYRNFNINSLKTSDPQKCKKVLLKWLSQ